MLGTHVILQMHVSDAPRAHTKLHQEVRRVQRALPTRLRWEQVAFLCKVAYVNQGVMGRAKVGAKLAPVASIRMNQEQVLAQVALQDHSLQVQASA